MQSKPITRRGAVSGIGLAATAAAVGSPAQAQAARKTFVLVHGGWHGGWCWRRVADLLQAKGYKVFTPTMTGLGACSHLLNKDVNISTHVADIGNFMKWEDLTDVVLVGHSYGGLVISGVAESLHDKIASIVFLDAFLPDNGDTILEKASPGLKDIISAAVGRGDLSLKAPPAKAFGVDEKDQAWVDSKCTPQPIGTFSEKAVYTGGRDKIAKKTFIRAKLYNSPTFDANLAKCKADGWKTYEMATGHDAMVTQPKELTDILIEAA